MSRKKQKYAIDFFSKFPTFFSYLIADQVDQSRLEVIQQLRGQNFAIFWHNPSPLPCVDKNRHFLTLSPPHLLHLVIEWPLTV